MIDKISNYKNFPINQKFISFGSEYQNKILIIAAAVFFFYAIFKFLQPRKFQANLLPPQSPPPPIDPEFGEALNIPENFPNPNKRTIYGYLDPRINEFRIKIVYSDGRIQEGTFKEGLLHGKNCKIVYPCAIVKKEKKFTIVHQSVRVEEGTFFEGFLHGQGILYSPFFNKKKNKICWFKIIGKYRSGNLVGSPISKTEIEKL